MEKLLYEDLTFAIIGVAMEVHRELGPGFLESIYQRAMEAELRARGIRFDSQKRIEVRYKSLPIGEHVLDLVVGDAIVVELKAATDLTRIHQAQVISYMRASGLLLALIINFAKPSLEHKRVLLKETLWPANSYARVR